jgi:hypothetical protein
MQDIVCVIADILRVGDRPMAKYEIDAAFFARCPGLQKALSNSDALTRARRLKGVGWALLKAGESHVKLTRGEWAKWERGGVPESNRRRRREGKRKDGVEESFGGKYLYVSRGLWERYAVEGGEEEGEDGEGEQRLEIEVDPIEIDSDSGEESSESEEE